MVNLIVILQVLLSFNSLSAELKLGVSNTDLGGIGHNVIKSILSCTTKFPENNIVISHFPSLRGKQELLNQSIDAYYPVIYNHLREENGLFPLYIDEVLMISIKESGHNKNISLGLAKGDNTHYLKKLKDYKLSFSVSNSKTLFRGLLDKRADAIIVKRSEIPKDFPLEKYELRSLEYVESGIELNSNFYKKIKMKKIEVKKNILIA